MKYAAVAAGGPEKAGQRKEHCVQQQNAGRISPPGKYYGFVYLLSATCRQIGIWRIPGHCEPVRFPGVAISWLEEQLLVEEFQKTVQKGQSV